MIVSKDLFDPYWLMEPDGFIEFSTTQAIQEFYSTLELAPDEFFYLEVQDQIHVQVTKRGDPVLLQHLAQHVRHEAVEAYEYTGDEMRIRLLDRTRADEVARHYGTAVWHDFDYTERENLLRIWRI